MIAALLLPLAAPVQERWLRLDATADTSICLHPSERTFNQGARTQLRVKGNEHVLLLDFDPEPIGADAVAEARLFLHPTGPHRLHALGLSTVAAPWEEGDGDGEANPGEVCFVESERGRRAWAGAGSDFLSVVFGRGGSLWAARESRSEPEGWISVEVPRDFVHALAEGTSRGLAVSDEKGQTRANNDVFSREAPGLGPYLWLRLVPGPRAPSGASLWRESPAAATGRDGEAGTRPAPRRLHPPPDPRPPEPILLDDGCRLLPLDEGAVASPDRFPAPHPVLAWDGSGFLLRGARGEHLAAALALATPAGERRKARVRWIGPPEVSFRASMGRFVEAGSGRTVDPLVPLDDKGVSVRGVSTLYLEWRLPTARVAGDLNGELVVETDRASLRIPARIERLDVAMPDDLGFRVSLNAYGSPGGAGGARPGSAEFLETERAFHRLAHEHRSTLAVVPYSQSGAIHEGMAPELRRLGDRAWIHSFEAWDARFGPLLDGSAFEGLPRGAIPVDHFLLPFHENWPLPLAEFYAYAGPLENHWREAPPIDEAFPPAYARAFARAVGDFARHASDRAWDRTDFLVFLNNKVDYRARGSGSSWWLLDEPAYRDDFLALRYFARLSSEGREGVEGGERVRFRLDLSSPQFRRDHLDGLLDLVVVNPPAEYRALVRETAARLGEEIWTYGEAPSPEEGGDAIRRWAIGAFLDGADGLVPWQSVGTRDAWDRLERTALLYPPREGDEPRPSVRLKWLRRAQQDVEWLRLLLERRGLPREALRRQVEAEPALLERPERLRLAATRAL